MESIIQLCVLFLHANVSRDPNHSFALRLTLKSTSQYEISLNCQLSSYNSLSRNHNIVSHY